MRYYIVILGLLACAALAAQQAGLTCICLSHTVSERFILKKFTKQLQKQAEKVTIKISKKDADPFKWKNL